jgi:cytochrome c oxidase subunit 4
MSAHAETHAPAAHHDENKFHLFVQVAMILAVITGVEIVAVSLNFLPAWLVVATLVILSVVKFMMVIFIFMHLKWDKVFCTILFFIGLILGGGTLAALLALTKMDASIPLTFTP